MNGKHRAGITHRTLSLCGLLVLLAGLAACAKPMAMVANLSQLKGTDVVVVGRLELVPPLQKEEQQLMLVGSGDRENQYHFLIGRKLVPIASPPLETKYDEILVEKFGTTFYVKNPARPMYFLTTFIYMQMSTRVVEFAWLPGGIVVNIRPGDKAVYMGTLRYHRNEFFDITKVQIVDDYAREKKAFQAKFGTRYPLVKRLAKPAKS